jgi:hypothetical protein
MRRMPPRPYAPKPSPMVLDQLPGICGLLTAGLLGLGLRSSCSRVRRTSTGTERGAALMCGDWFSESRLMSSVGLPCVRQVPTSLRGRPGSAAHFTALPPSLPQSASHAVLLGG